MKIRFCGAAHMVAGSSYYVETNTHKFLVDCGLFQGPSVEHLNYESFPYNPAELDFVLLTHTHIDHTGLLPKLARFGFKGQLYCTTTSARLLEYLLLDSAKIQEGNLRRYNQANSTDHKADAEVAEIASEFYKTTQFMYNTADAMTMLSKVKSVEYGDTVEFGEDLKVKFVDSGHILGAASLQVTYNEDGKQKRILFSGDIGQRGQALVSAPAPADGFKPDVILMEATYGGKLHESRIDTVNKLIDIIKTTTARKQNVIIPSFAAQRTQELLFEIKKAKMFGKLPIQLEVFVDSPLANKITDVYQKSWQYLNAETKMFFENMDNAFNFPHLYFTRNSQDSMTVNKKKGVVIIAGSGMCTGGRVMQHLAVNLPNPDASIILVGYQAEETLGRELAEGAKEVTIEGKPYAVRAPINRLFGFSAHADNNGLMEFFKQYHFDNTKKAFLVHADPERAAGLKKSILEFAPEMEVNIPDIKEDYEF
jgi:metallo-beta-lactamase family protein